MSFELAEQSLSTAVATSRTTAKTKAFFFTIDKRSLALFRIAIAAVLVNDWFVRWPHIEAFYTAAGILPADAPLPPSGGAYHFSLLDPLTSLAMVQLAFCAGLACYVLFLLGWHTKLFQLASFLFFVSVVNRNVLLRHRGEVVLVSMFLWSLFLPLGARFSLDALRARGRGGTRDATSTAPSAAAFFIVLQLALIYFFSAFAKSGHTWSDGTALYYTLKLDIFARSFGTWLGDRPLWVLKAVTWASLAVEYLAGPLMLVPFAQPRLRRWTIVALIALHLGTWATLVGIGDFPFVMIATYPLLLTTADWDAARRWLPRRAASGAREGAAQRPASGASAERSHWAVVQDAIAVLIGASVVLSVYDIHVAPRLGREPLPEPVVPSAIIKLVQIDRDWNLFAPDPMTDDGWWVSVGTDESGAAFDPLTGAPPTWDKPDELAYRNNRLWRKYLYRLWLNKYIPYRPYLARYLCAKSARDGHRLTWLDMYYVLEKTQPPGAPEPFPTKRFLMLRHSCRR